MYDMYKEVGLLSKQDLIKGKNSSEKVPKNEGLKRQKLEVVKTKRSLKK